MNGLVKQDTTHLFDPCQLLVVLQKEGQILEADVNVRITPKLPMFFFRLPTPGEPMSINLVLDLSRRIRHEDARIGIRRAHLRLWPLERGEEFRMQKSRLGVLELLCDIPCEAEVWILVNCAGDQARDVGRIAKDVGERIREGRGGLDRRKVNLANVVAAGCPRPAFVQRFV